MLRDLAKYHKPAPRYTSYPTAPEWGALGSSTYLENLKSFAKSDKPLSLYFHIPFCHKICLFCACAAIANRKIENEKRYVDALCKEIDLVTQALGKKLTVPQIHFGGGTPTKLSEKLMSQLFEKITTSFEIDFSKEVAIEIDPRTVSPEKLRFLRDLGFNRVSFGVQDVDPKVQEAIKRRQSAEMTEETYLCARELGFEGINLDLIYGLPYQTRKSFSRTVETILTLRPDRIALFSYAKVPWLKPHQKAIRDETLPSTEEKFKIYEAARQAFIENGYVAIGMDHFALETDEMARAYHDKTLRRNFQGYTVEHAEDSIGFGITAIGYLEKSYFQNLKGLVPYYTSLNNAELPICRGLILNKEDLIRKWVIHTLMCTFELNKEEFAQKFGLNFDHHFAHELEKLEESELIHITPQKLIATPLGELFIRNSAMVFDDYLNKKTTQPQFSQSI
ncbi:MAG: Oxygen-independent coproporphyrinogen-III oxidase [Chlamydiae bacterium]|nr:Oxygen-independent coproporphyrinogen-III oxidase [Chlamydiota bacterium]